MRLTPRVLVLPVALAAGLLVSCDSPTRAPTMGRIEPRFVLVKDTKSMANLVALNGMRATITAPGGSTVIAFTTLTQASPPSGPWTGSILDVAPGSYQLTVEGTVNGAIQHYGRSTSNITVVAGQAASAPLLIAPVVPSIPTFAVADTNEFSQVVSLATDFTLATGWEYQLSQNADFTGANITTVNGATPTFTITVTDVGTWHLRSRPVLPFKTADQVVWSDPQTFVITPSTGGRSSANAINAGLISGVPDTIVDRNITSALTEGWYVFPARAGDSLFAETRAQRLTPASPLNSTIALFRADGTTPVAGAVVTDDIAGSTDSRVVAVAPATENYLVRVGRAGGTVGHYDLILELRRLPAAPTGVAAIATSATGARVRWNDVADNETTYRIERCLGPACTDFAEVGTAAENDTSFAEGGLTAGSTYRYQVRARNAIGNSAYVGPVTVALQGPTAPDGLTATTISGSRIDLTWNDLSDNETGFEIERCALASCTDGDYTDVATVAAGTEAYSNTGLAVDGRYTYRVRATNLVAPSAYSNTATANTIRPAAPLTLGATTISATRIDLTWSDTSSIETGFSIERCSAQGCSTFAAIGTTAADVTTYSDLTAVPETFYTYRVRATNVAGGSDPSNSALANTRAPGVPASFAATVVSAARVDLSWSDTTAAETGFQVERCGGAGCAVFNALATVAAGSTGYSDLTVAVDSTYRYRVRATGVAGNSADAGPVLVSLLLPAPPTGLAAATASGTQVNLTWTDASDNETTFRVERCTGAACTDFAEIGSVAAGVSSYNDLTVAAEGDYRYQVRARNAVGSSAYTSIVTASTRTATTPGTLVATQISATQIDLAWQDLSSNETGFRIERCSGAACSTFTEVTTVAANVQTFQNTGLAAGASYTYRVRAVNAVAASAPSNTATATTAAPGAPTDLASLTVTPTRIDLSWTDASIDELGFSIERCTGADCDTFAEIAIAGAGSVSFQDSPVAADEDYRYRIRAFNAVGFSPYSATLAADTRAPQAPTSLNAATVSGSRIDLDWADNAGNELGVVIERCDLAACAFAAIDTVAANVTTFSDLTVAVDVSYSYRVVAYNNAGASAASGTAEANTLLPVAPSDLAATTLSGTSIGLEWTNNALDANGFIIERCAGPACADFAAIDSTSGAVTTFTDLSVTVGNAYNYQVRARSIVGRSLPSTAAGANTLLPTTPTGLTATTITATRIDLAWTDASGNETGYTVERCAGAGCADFASVATLPANATAYQSTELTPDESYSFRVLAFNAAGASSASNVATASTDLPAAPLGLAASILNTTQIQLSWTDSATNETSYVVEWCEGAGCTNYTGWAGGLPPDTEQYLVDVDLPGETLRFRIGAVNLVGSAYSEPVQFTMAAPTAPDGLLALALSTTRIDLSWNDNSDNETGFLLYRCAGAGCDPIVATPDTLPAGTTTRIDSTVTAGEIWRYRVRAFSTAFGPSGGVGTIAEASTILPDAPTNLNAVTFSSSQIDLTWDDVATNESAYELERCTGASCTDFARIDSLAPNSVSYNDVGLTPQLAFRYRLRAINGAGASAYTAIVDATTNVPSDPSALVATATSPSAITIAWSDNSDNETDFVIQRCPAASCADGDFIDLSVVGANVTQYVDGTLALGNVATYRVKAINLNGSSRYSNAATASVTAPAMPTAFAAAVSQANRIAMTWTDEATNETGYEVERCAGVGCGDFARVDSLPADRTSYTDSATVLDETYTYRIRAVNFVGASDYSGVSTTNTIRPLDPTALSATTLSATQVDLAWTDNATNEDGFEVERCAGADCTDFTALATVAPDAVTYNDLTVVVGQLYSYRVRGVNVAGASGYAGPATASTLLPADPTALNAVVSAPTEITLSWTDNATNETGFRLERCAGNGCNTFVQVATPAADATQYVDGGLVSNTFYRYRLRAYNAAGVSAYTPIATPNTFAPAQPTDLALTTVLGDRIDLSWTDPASNETGFRIERCTGSLCTEFTEIATVAANVTTHADSTLAFGTTYRYRIRSYNGVANSAYTAEVEGNTNVPLDPTDLSAAAKSNTRIDLTWTDNASNETGFRVERCAGPGCSDFALLVELGADATSHSDTPIAAATSFTYRVRAFNEGSSGWSTLATATTILPSDPTSLAAVAVAGDRIDLSWDDNADNEFGYQVERCAGTDCADFALVHTTAADVAAYSDLPLAGGVLYRYRIRAFNGAGPSAYTTVAQATTNVPGIPTTLTATTFDASRIDLAWVDNAADETGFVIERCTGSGCTTFVAIDSVEAANATSYSNTGLAAGITFRYRVRSYNASGVSGASNVATAGTNTPAAPTALTATTVSATRVDLTWLDNADNEGAYVVERCTGVSCTDFAEIVTLPIDASAYSDLGVVVNTTYRYQVRATNNAGASGYTEVVTVDTDVPAAPTALVASTVSATRIDLTWTDASDNEADFRIERCVGPGCSDFVELATVPAGTQAYSDEGLTPDESYTYLVRATNAAGSSTSAGPVTATTAIPADPSGLTATTISANRIDLAWTDNSTNELQFTIERCDDPTCTGATQVLGTVGADVTAYSDETVTVGNQYGYRVFATNAAGASGVTTAVGSTLLPTVPGAGAAVISAPDRVDLTWTDLSDNEDGFVVERCTGKDCADFAPIASVDRNLTAFEDTGLGAGEYYSYRFRATNAAGSSDPSATITTALVVPDDALGLTATTLSATQAQLSWTDNSFNETGFVIERCRGVGCTEFAAIDTVGVDVTTFQSDDLEFDDSWSFRVLAVNPVGLSNPSNVAVTTTSLPALATGLTATVVAPNQINLAWTDNSTNEAGFRIERCSGPGCTDFVEVGTTSADVVGYADATLSLNTVYVYRVRPFNAVGPADYSNEATDNTLLPADPTGITATAITVNRIDLTWADNATNEGFYVIEACQGSGCTSFAAVAVLGSDVTSYSYTSAAANVIYRVRVRAFRSNVGSSGYTTSGDISTVLDAPTGMRAQTVLRNRVDLTWTDNTQLETGYQVLVCAGAGCVPNSLAANLAANTTSYQYNGLSQNQTYSFRVRAVSNSTLSATTATAGAYTPVTLVSGQTSAAVSDTLGAERYFVVNVPAGTPELRITMSGGTGEADLFLRYAAAPTLSTWDCRPYPIGNTESCVINNPAAGDWYFMPHAYQAISGVFVKASLGTRYGYPTAFANTGSWSPNYLIGQTLFVSQPITVTHLGLQVAGGTGGVRIGLYTHNGSLGIPGSLVTSISGTILGTGQLEWPTAAVQIPAGTYWVMYNFQNSITRTNDPLTLTTTSYVTLTYGSALPGTYTTTAYNALLFPNGYRNYEGARANAWVRGYP